MDTLEGIKKLAHEASKEKIPEFSVVDNVLLRIRADVDESYSLIPFGLMGGLSAIAASVVLFLGINAWTYLSNPVMQLFTAVPEVQLW